MLTVDVASWQTEVRPLEEHYQKLGSTVPDELRERLRELEKRSGQQEVPEGPLSRAGSGFFRDPLFSFSTQILIESPVIQLC